MYVRTVVNVSDIHKVSPYSGYHRLLLLFRILQIPSNELWN